MYNGYLPGSSETFSNITSNYIRDLRIRWLWRLVLKNNLGPPSTVTGAGFVPFTLTAPIPGAVESERT